MPFTIDLAAVGRDDLGLVGGKAANLGELIRADFPVPAGFVVTTTAYADAVGHAGLGNATPAELHAGLPSCEIPAEVADAVTDGYRALGSPPVAVRSSGVAEDLADASFAGQHDTVLDVGGERDLLAAVRACWASLWTPRAVAYRERAGHDVPGLSLAVVVQTMVDAEWAGVLFTADPVTGRRDKLVVEAVRGLGESLVSGTATGYRELVDKNGTPPVSHSPLPTGVLAELTDLGQRVEDAFGSPQDVEWTYADGRCALVQARPLTALPDPPPAEPMDFRMQQVADHLPQPPYKVDCALLLRPMVRKITAFFDALGIAVSAPGEILVENDDGARVVAPDARRTMRMAYRIPVMLPTVLPVLRTAPSAWRADCERTLVPLARHALTDDLSQLGDDELLDRVGEILQVQTRLVPGRFGCAVPRLLLGDRVLTAVLGLVAGHERRDELRTELLAGVTTITSTANREVTDLAARIRSAPELAAVYREGEPAEIPGELHRSAAGRELLADVAGYLDRYGYRQPVTPLPGFATLAETPHRVHAMLRGLASRDVPETSGEARAAAAEQALRRHRGPRAAVLTPLALRLVRTGRTGIAFREDSHCLAFMLPAAAIRRLLLELGGRLVDRGVLDTATDVVHLEPTELTELPPTALRDLAARRRRHRDAALARPGPTPVTDGSAIRGIPASRGTVDGVVRVVADEDDFGKLDAGEVLVCPYTNPAWTPLFAVASAVVTDAGGAASHAAIVAREYGIPAVMGTGDATRRLRDGQRVRVDGTAGTVIIDP